MESWAILTATPTQIQGKHTIRQKHSMYIMECMVVDRTHVDFTDVYV